jgi:hypothetical protein
VRGASKAQNPLVLGISAGPGEYAASIRELLAAAAIDALMVFYAKKGRGLPCADVLSLGRRLGVG